MAGTAKTELERRILDGFLDKIYAFSYKRTRNHVDADDLSQEILLEIFSSLSKTGSIRNFNAWIWRIAHNTFCQWLEGKIKREANFTYCESGFFKGVDMAAPDECENEMLSLVHREISFLSQIHRKVFVSHYLKGMKCREIAKEQNIPAGTVKRMLSEARRTIKNGVDEMRDYNEKSHTSMTLCIRTADSCGNGTNPKELVRRKVVQAILLESAATPVSVRQISEGTGIPCIYIEDEIQNLLDSGLMAKAGKGLFLTNFVIRAGSLEQELIGFMKGAVKDFIPEYDKIIAHVKANYGKEGINSQNIPWKQFLWIVLYRIYSLAYHNSCMAESPRESGKWQPYGFVVETDYSEDERMAWGWHDKPRGVIMPGADGCGFVAYKTYWSLGQKLLANGKPALYSDALSLCRKVFSGDFNLKEASEEERTCLSELIQDGVIGNNGGILTLKTLAFTREQHSRFDELIKERLSGAVKVYERAMGNGMKLVRKHAPKKIDEENIRNFVLAGQGAGGIAGLLYGEYVKRGDLCAIDVDAPFTPTCYVIL
jgi:RNA polymerase sigma factor (sigma-70 family)